MRKLMSGYENVGKMDAMLGASGLMPDSGTSSAVTACGYVDRFDGEEPPTEGRIDMDERRSSVMPSVRPQSFSSGTVPSGDGGVICPIATGSLGSRTQL